MTDQDTPQMDPARVAEIDGMLRTVVRRESAARSRSKRKMLAWLAIPVVAVSAVVTAAVVAPKTAPITNTAEVACFARAEFNGTDDTFPGTYQSVMGDPNVRDPDGYTPAWDMTDPTNAMAACAALWEDGSLKADAPSGFLRGTPSGAGAVPAELTLCVLPNGSGAVIPGDSGVCDRLRLPTPKAP
jgi:hypothetical protein